MADFLKDPIPPPRRTNASGNPRKLGVEIEFAGITARAAAGIICDVFGGTITAVDVHRYNVEGTTLGDFRSELDTRFAHPADMLPEGANTPVWLANLTQTIAGPLGDLGSVIVPCEVVTPPVQLDDITALDALIGRLKAAGAHGTDQSVFYAFGLHLNLEVASTDPAWLVGVMRAQALLSAWLRAVMQIDNSRYLTGFAKPYPQDYLRLLFSADYHPDPQELIDDYLLHNRSRNFELDMLPLFAWMDEDRVRTALPDEKTKKRPAFHYRLPNAALERPAWSIALEWNRWCLIERLAESPDAINSLAEDYFEMRAIDSEDAWVRYMSEWLAHSLHHQAVSAVDAMAIGTPEQ